MSVFAQYAPYQLAVGDWDSRRAEIAGAVLDRIALWAPDVARLRRALAAARPARRRGADRPDRRPHLPGVVPSRPDVGPADARPRRRSPGLYLCGAATHPGGSVIGINGRNAAMAVLADRAGAAPVELACLATP